MCSPVQWESHSWDAWTSQLPELVRGWFIASLPAHQWQDACLPLLLIRCFLSLQTTSTLMAPCWWVTCHDPYSSWPYFTIPHVPKWHSIASTGLTSHLSINHILQQPNHPQQDLQTPHPKMGQIPWGRRLTYGKKNRDMRTKYTALSLICCSIGLCVYCSKLLLQPPPYSSRFWYHTPMF